MLAFENSKRRNFSRVGQVTSSRHPRQRDESSGERRKLGGVGEASPGELPGTDRIPTKQDVLNTGLDPMLLISQQKVQDIYSGGCHGYVSAAGRHHAHSLQKQSEGPVQESSWWRRPVYRQGT